ncbi:hypothetical protein KC352_g23 [Hortaea werneckii]|nr:hypothetical protein KC352_g23 [Hortaea werneckii]
MSVDQAQTTPSVETEMMLLAFWVPTTASDGVRWTGSPVRWWRARVSHRQSYKTGGRKWRVSCIQVGLSGGGSRHLTIQVARAGWPGSWCRMYIAALGISEATSFIRLPFRPTYSSSSSSSPVRDARSKKSLELVTAFSSSGSVMLLAPPQSLGAVAVGFLLPLPTPSRARSASVAVFYWGCVSRPPFPGHPRDDFGLTLHRDVVDGLQSGEAECLRLGRGGGILILVRPRSIEWLRIDVARDEGVDILTRLSGTGYS